MRPVDRVILTRYVARTPEAVAALQERRELAGLLAQRFRAATSPLGLLRPRRDVVPAPRPLVCECDHLDVHHVGGEGPCNGTCSYGFGCTCPSFALAQDQDREDLLEDDG